MRRTTEISPSELAEFALLKEGNVLPPERYEENAVLNRARVEARLVEDGLYESRLGVRRLTADEHLVLRYSSGVNGHAAPVLRRVTSAARGRKGWPVRLEFKSTAAYSWR